MASDFLTPFHDGNARQPRSASGQRRPGSFVPLCEYLISVIVFPLKTALPSLADGDIPLAYGIFFKTHPKACLLRRRLGKSKRMFEKYVGNGSTWNRRLPLPRPHPAPPHPGSWIVTVTKKGRGFSSKSESVGFTVTIKTTQRVARASRNPEDKEHILGLEWTLGRLRGKESALSMQEMGFQSLGQENPLEEEMTNTPVFLPG